MASGEAESDSFKTKTVQNQTVLNIPFGKHALRAQP